jgi:hypothetical protein
MEVTDNIVAINLPKIKKYIRKHPVTGMVEREEWFQFNYRVTGVKYEESKWSWNRVLYVNVEVSDKYWIFNSNLKKSEWRYRKYMWSSVRRNQYIRGYVRDEVKQFFDIFSIPCRVEIKTIKMKQE